LIWAAEQLSPYSITAERKAQMTMLENIEDCDADEFTYSDSLFNSCLALTGKGNFELKSWGPRFLFFGFVIFSVVMLANYTANLTSFLTVPAPPDNPIKGVSDLAKYKFGCLNGSSGQAYILQYQTKEIQNNMVIRNRNVELLALLASGDIRAMFGDTKNLQFIANTMPCDKYLAGGLITNFHYGFAIPIVKTADDQAFYDAISAATLELRDSGTIDGLYQSWWKPQIDPCVTTDPTTNPLNPSDFAGLFIAVGILLGCGFVAFLVESIFGTYYHTMTNNIKSGKWKDKMLLLHFIESVHSFFGGASDELTRKKPVQASE